LKVAASGANGAYTLWSTTRKSRTSSTESSPSLIRRQDRGDVRDRTRQCGYGVTQLRVRSRTSPRSRPKLAGAPRVRQPAREPRILQLLHVPVEVLLAVRHKVVVQFGDRHLHHPPHRFTQV